MSKTFNHFLAVLLGTIFFWAIAFISYEIWLGIEPELLPRNSRIVIDRGTGQKIIYIEPDSITENHNTFVISALGAEAQYVSKYLEAVGEFGPLKLGGEAPNGFGQIAPFEGRKIPKSNFYVYAHRRGLSLCEYDSCSVVEGRVIACMGGWLSGDGHTEVSDLVGLDSSEVGQGRASIVVVSDKNSKIIGIYPNHTEGDILPVLSQFPEYHDSLVKCSDREIGPLL